VCVFFVLFCLTLNFWQHVRILCSTPLTICSQVFWCSWCASSSCVVSFVFSHTFCVRVWVWFFFFFFTFSNTSGPVASPCSRERVLSMASLSSGELDGKRGFLMKVGKNNHAWRRRWFVLSENFLLYLESSKDSSPLGEIPVQDAFAREAAPIQGSDLEEQELGFDIVTTHRTYHLLASSAEDRLAWLSAVKRAKANYWRSRKKRIASTKDLKKHLRQMNEARARKPEREGWLSKQGGRVKNWKRRWFILRNDTLYYFTSAQANDQAGSIPLHASSVSRSHATSSGRRKYEFQVGLRFFAVLCCSSQFVSFVCLLFVAVLLSLFLLFVCYLLLFFFLYVYFLLCLVEVNVVVCSSRAACIHCSCHTSSFWCSVFSSSPFDSFFFFFFFGCVSLLRPRLSLTLSQLALRFLLSVDCHSASCVLLALRKRGGHQQVDDVNLCGDRRITRRTRRGPRILTADDRCHHADQSAPERAGDSEGWLASQAGWQGEELEKALVRPLQHTVVLFQTP
jgi:PH domain